MKKKSALKLLLCFMLISRVCYSFALDPNKALYQYLHAAWLAGEGLPQASINAVIQTRDGYIWLGTQEGLVRFDGIRFTVFDKSNTPALKGNHIAVLFEDSKGSLWIGTAQGLTRFKDGEFTLYTTENGLPGNMIKSICGDRQGNTWIGCGSWVSHFKDETFVSFTAKDGIPGEIAHIYEDRQGDLWIGTQGNGLFRWKDKKLSSYTAKDGLSGHVINSIYEDRQGNLWIGAQDGLYHWQDGKFTTYTTKDGLSSNIIYSLHEDRQENLWIGTYGGGLCRWSNGKFSSFTTKQGLTDDIVVAITTDREGSLWIGTYNGLNRLQDGKFTTLTLKDGLPWERLYTVFEDTHGCLWMSTNGGGLIRWKNGKSSAFTKKEGLPGNEITFLGEDKEKNLWIGTFGKGIIRIKDGKFTTYSTKDGLSDNVVTAMGEDSQGMIWIGTMGGGINWFQKGKIIPAPISGNQTINNVKRLHEDRNGGMWIGAIRGGLFRWHNGKLTHFTTKYGLSGNRVLSIYEDNEGTIWIGYYDGGLNRWKNNQFTTYTSKDGLFNDTVYQILEDGKENLWMSCNKGIFTVSKKKLNAFAEGKISKISCISYDKNDGMISSECNGGSSPAGCKTRDGKLCFPTEKGLVIIDPENINLNEVQPSVVVEDILVDTRIIPLARGKKIQLSPGAKEFEIHYTALSFQVPKKVKFKYRLEGFNDDWVEADTRRTAYFTNIPPGDYRFRVIACNNDGLWNQEGAYIDFYLQPYFYQTVWFYLLLGLSVLLSGFGFYGFRVKQLKKREAELERMVEERTHQLEKLSIVARETDNGVMIMDPAGNIEWVNESFLRLYSVTLDLLPTIIGKNLLQVSLNRNIRDIINRCINEKKTIIYESSAENRDGKTIWTQTALTPIVDEDGNINQLVTIDSDITRVKEAEKAAERANQSKSEFLARMSHEIRTPMNGVIGFTEMLMETGLTDEQLDYVKTISQSGEALITLLNDILDFSKIEAGELSFDPMDFDPELTAFDVCNIVAPRLSGKPVEVLCRIGDDVPAYVKSDAGRFRQVLINLVGNAVKFTEKGEIELTLEVEEEEERRIKVHLKVRDTGIGIPGDKLGMIFDVFQQADSSTTRKYGGTGLGLAICKQIATLMGGDIWAESIVGQGSTFHFSAWLEKSKKLPGNETPRQYLAGKKVLILDDNIINLEILTHVLEVANLRVVQFSRPDTVAEAIGQNYSQGDPFDLGIIDIQMPGISGYDVAKQIRRLDPPMCNLPLLAFSSSTLDRSAKFKKSGFNGFLPKPIQRRKLLTMMEYLLGNKENLEGQAHQEGMITQHSIIEKAKHSIRILLAEDNPINQKLADFILTKAGYQVKIVENGKEAVEVYSADPGKFDLIFMDLQMPEMGGKEATEILRQKGFKEIPIIAMTADSMIGDYEKCLEAGMNDYIPKPIKREIVFEKVKKWCLNAMD